MDDAENSVAGKLDLSSRSNTDDSDSSDAGFECGVSESPSLLSPDGVGERPHSTRLKSQNTKSDPEKSGDPVKERRSSLLKDMWPPRDTIENDDESVCTDTDKMDFNLVSKEPDNQLAGEEDEPDGIADSNSKYAWTILLTLVFFAMLAYMGSALSHPVEEETPLQESAPQPSARQLWYERFMSEFKTMRASHPSQDDRFWRTIGVAIKRVVQNEDCSSPAVVIIAANSDMYSNALNITREISKLVSSTRGQTKFHFVVNAKAELMHLPGDEAKEQLDKILQRHFEHGRRVAVVSHLEALPWQAASMLHSYCDHESANYKDAIFLAAVEIPSTQPLVASIVEDFLEEQWKGYGLDNVKALLSRVANNIAIFHEHLESNRVVTWWRQDMQTFSESLHGPLSGNPPVDFGGFPSKRAGDAENRCLHVCNEKAVE